MGRREHWEGVWRGRASEELGWHQDHPEPSLGLIVDALPDHGATILDVGGGDSRLVDRLLEAGYKNLTVLDISATVLARARRRLGERAAEVQWLEADVTELEPPAVYDLWHDRAVFHFLTEADDRAGYRRALGRSLTERGQAVISTFSLAGPPRCSGLDVVRYSAETLAAELGPELRLVGSGETMHRTPSGSDQSFLVCRLARHRESF